MTALAWEAGRNYASDMVMICQILDHEENLDNTQKVVETLSGFITEFQLVHKYARPDYICKEKKRAYAREHRQRLAAEARAAEAVLPDENEGLAATGLSPEEASYLSTERGIRWFDPNSSPEPSEFTLDEEVEDRSEVVPPAALNDQPQAVPQGTVNWPNT